MIRPGLVWSMYEQTCPRVTLNYNQQVSAIRWRVTRQWFSYSHYTEWGEQSANTLVTNVFSCDIWCSNMCPFDGSIVKFCKHSLLNLIHGDQAQTPDTYCSSLCLIYGKIYERYCIFLSLGIINIIMKSKKSWHSKGRNKNIFVYEFLQADSRPV